MKPTMDRSGRLVIPAAIRRAAGLAPGVPLEIRVRDGGIEIRPAPREIRIRDDGGFHVAEAVDGAGLLTQAQVRRTLDAVRRGRGDSGRGDD